jgi:threonine dehydrogenase-like Zn-dependent dehydrogenase
MIPKHLQEKILIMKALTLHAEWNPKPDYKMSDRERETRKVKNGFMAWKNPRISLETTPDPTPAPDEIIVAVGAVGICGSDMHMYEAAPDGYMMYPGYVTAPNILGHEFAGRVAAVGSEVNDLVVGDLVAVEEIQWCGVCVACRRGFVNHCENMEELGFTTPGAMAQYTPVRAKYCWKLDELAAQFGEDEALVMGAMVEPTGVAYQGMFNRLTTWRPGYNVVIFGAGPIGLAAEALAIAAGAGQVIMFEPSASRRKIAENMGASSVIDPAAVDDMDEAILELTFGRGVDYVVECSGVPDKTIQQLNRSLAVNASIIDIGMGGRRPELPTVTYKQQGVQLAGSLGHSGSGTFQNVIRLMAAGRIDMLKMVSDRVALDDAPSAFKRLESREDAKIILHPN